MSLGSPIHFPTTRWSLVLRAGGGEAGEARVALDELLRRYLRPLRAYLLHSRGLPEAEAEDLLQGFIADRILEQALIGAADPERGRFRTFLLCALDRYLVDRMRYQSRLKRQANGAVLTIEQVGDVAHRGGDPRDLFDVEWAREVLGRTLQSMRRQCEAGDREDLWAVFEARVLGPTLAGEPPVPYPELAQRLGRSALDQGPNLLVTAKRMFQRSLRQVVGEYAADEREVDAEIVELERILSGEH
jgi:DNA-directed RNA polymerase specialized sigma24 family protein